MHLLGEYSQGRGREERENGLKREKASGGKKDSKERRTEVKLIEKTKRERKGSQGSWRREGGSGWVREGDRARRGRPKGNRGKGGQTQEKKQKKEVEETG